MSTAGPITIEVPLEELEILQETMRREVGRAIHRARKRLERELLEVVPFRSGELFESMKLWESATGLGIRFDAPYARIVEMGAAPHAIDAAEGGPLLHFWVKGKEIFTEHVDHPGYSGRGFIWKVKQKVLDVVREELMMTLLAASMG